MRLLVDEGVPVQVLDPLRRNHGHAFQHVDELGWKGKQDEFLFDDARKGGFDGLLALDVDQLADPDECKRLRRAGLHHVSLRQGSRVKGRKGVARIIASTVVAMPYVLEDLQGVQGQRVVEISLLSGSPRHETFDPRRDSKRFPYWPR
jgi:hypothetical protein